MTMPLTRAELELTESCNIQCRFCYNSRNPVMCENPESLINRLAEAGCMELILTGGEPTLHPRFLEVVEYASDRIPRVMIQTNGLAFSSPDFLDALVRNKVFCVNVSLHGPREIHEALTQAPGSFDRVCESIRGIIGRSVRLASNVVLTGFNSDPSVLRSTVDVYNNLGIEEMTVTRFLPCGLGSEEQDLLVSPGALIVAFDTLKDFTGRRKISLLVGTAMPACKIPKRLWDLCSRCSFGFDKFYVSAKGALLICGMSRVSLGDINHSSISKTLRLSELRNRYLSGNHIPKDCRACPNLDICGGGCRASALAFTDCFDGMDAFQLDDNRHSTTL